MKHLDVLESAGFVTITREGRQRWNHLNPVPIEQICQRWLDQHRRRIKSAFNRLKNIAEQARDEEKGAP